ncbi:MAG: hypothetical protein OH316_01860 [Candidatus Parvarchaeota archaeon]|nr:hypothetical protein [Candidatus Parvarchaeota archaeon]
MSLEDNIEYLKRKGEGNREFENILNSMANLRPEYDYFELVTPVLSGSRMAYKALFDSNIIPRYLEYVPHFYITERSDILNRLLKVKEDDPDIVFDRSILFGGNILDGDYYIFFLTYDNDEKRGRTYLLWRDSKRSGLDMVSTWGEEGLNRYRDLLEKMLNETLELNDPDGYG